ncbi:MAG: aminotransferase class I/II-fold pyridoxal phosphate-dependent enzyme [Candidatus Magasanikbacteria bacterium]|nr:aminotransferase class I/II-fold pyridoxal phosphate-dependent enzyme [Candidatus Magasanikbacteria bacterium]
MKLFKKTIFTGFAPNITKKDISISLSFLLFPWNWLKLKNGSCGKKVLNFLKNYFDANVFLFDSGRSSLYFALKSLGVKKGDEVLVQAYTCVVVINAIKWTGAKPIFVDINDDFNIDIFDLKKKLSNKSKVLILQHTFGLPADIDSALKISKEYGIKVIEDCAHSLGVRYKNKLTGTFADIGMLSFGSDKVISCIRGGALITNDEKISKKLAQYQDNLKNCGIIKIIQHLLQIPIFKIGKRFYSLGIGKWLLYFSKLFNIVNRIVYNQEKRGKKVPFYPTKLPNALACLLFYQLNNLEKRNEHRKKIAKKYFNLIDNKKVKLPIEDKNHLYLRFTLITDQREKLKKIAKEENIILGDWYDCVIAPKDINMKATGYNYGSCPKAEELAGKSINLPTNLNIGNNEVNRIVAVVNNL